MTIISDTAKEVINKDKRFQKVVKKLKAKKKAGGNMDEYFLGKDPRKTKYYKEMMKK
ncbi:MAG: hypothetical protein KAJ49_06015 [Arcobacteraceae bacterium]|nr:hypothetical protein [Arcobacteraceae bacterium]